MLWPGLGVWLSEIILEKEKSKELKSNCIKVVTFNSNKKHLPKRVLPWVMKSNVQTKSFAVQWAELSFFNDPLSRLSSWGRCYFQRFQAESPVVGEPQSTPRPNNLPGFAVMLFQIMFCKLLKDWRLIWDILLVKINYRFSDDSVLAIVPNVDQGQKFH